MKLILYTSCSSDENVIRNRLTPFITEALNKNFAVEAITVEGNPFDIDHQAYNQIPIKGEQLRGSNFFQRAIKEFLLSKKILKTQISSNTSTQITLVTMPSMFLLFQYKRRKGINILDIRDLTWEYLQGSLIKNFSRVIFKHWAKRSLKHFDYITVTNPSEKKYLTNILNVDSKKVFLVSNGITIKQFKMLLQVKHNSKNQRKRITYIGNIGLAQDLSTLVQAAVDCPEIDFYIIGTGTDFNRINLMVKENKLKNVFLLGKLPWQKVLTYYDNTDFLYAQLTPEYSTAVPSKLYEYIVSGKKIIYGGDNGEAKNILENFKGVDVIPPVDPTALIKAIKTNNQTVSLDKKDIEYNRNLIQDKYIRENTVSNFYKHIINQTN